MYVCMYVYIYTYACTYACIYERMYIMYVRRYVCKRACVCLCACVCCWQRVRTCPNKRLEYESHGADAASCRQRRRVTSRGGRGNNGPYIPGLARSRHGGNADTRPTGSSWASALPARRFTVLSSGFPGTDRVRTRTNSSCEHANRARGDGKALGARARSNANLVSDCEFLAGLI